MTSRFSITLLVMTMTTSVLFGVGAIVVLSIPILNDHAKILLPIATLFGFPVGPLAAWDIAPLLRAQYWNPSYSN